MLAEASGQRGVAWSAHWALAVLAGLTGKAEEVRRHLDDAHRVADELRSPLFRLWTSEVEIEYAAGIGEWDHAVALAERTIAMARSLSQRTLLASRARLGRVAATSVAATSNAARRVWTKRGR